MALVMKYFVLKPSGSDPYAVASRDAMVAYAKSISGYDGALSIELLDWVALEWRSADPQEVWDESRWAPYDVKPDKGDDTMQMEPADIVPMHDDILRKALTGIVPMCDDIKERAKAALRAAEKEVMSMGK